MTTTSTEICIMYNRVTLISLATTTATTIQLLSFFQLRRKDTIANQKLKRFWVLLCHRRQNKCVKKFTIIKPFGTILVHVLFNKIIFEMVRGYHFSDQKGGGTMNCSYTVRLYVQGICGNNFPMLLQCRYGKAFFPFTVRGRLHLRFCLRDGLLLTIFCQNCLAS
jgi:hypothetical protein